MRPDAVGEPHHTNPFERRAPQFADEVVELASTARSQRGTVEGEQGIGAETHTTRRWRCRWRRRRLYDQLLRHGDGRWCGVAEREHKAGEPGIDVLVIRHRVGNAIALPLTSDREMGRESELQSRAGFRVRLPMLNAGGKTALPGVPGVEPKVPRVSASLTPSLAKANNRSPNGTRPTKSRPKRRTRSLPSTAPAGAVGAVNVKLPRSK